MTQTFTSRHRHSLPQPASIVASVVEPTTGFDRCYGGSNLLAEQIKPPFYWPR
jgi:hypothetical protein